MTLKLISQQQPQLEFSKLLSNKKAIQRLFVLLLALFCLVKISPSYAQQHPNLVVTQNDVVNMRAAITHEGRFQKAYLAKKKSVDALLSVATDVPVPKDGGGGYTHERHKKNAQSMYDAGVLYQLTQEKKYAQYTRDMLLRYAKLYPTLPLHPKRKMGKQNPGKLFWQSLNEAVWLVYTSQAYDLVYNAISAEERSSIETGLFHPIVKFLSVESPETFNKIHNHGTWTTAAVGMTGYVLGKKNWVEQALYGLDKSGKGGFMRQLDELFSPQGYYTEGPYYQRYALMPFVTFAKSIQTNEPQRKIFSYRNNVLLKAINTTVQLSYNQLFFPINDAIKSKGTDTIELVNGIALAYGLTQDDSLLSIAKSQNTILLTGDGLKVAQGLDQHGEKPYHFESKVFGDGKEGNEGALVVMRQNVGSDQAVLFKPTSQGMGHGHFDKLTWQFYDHGEEILSDYGAARFLNVEAKFGGRYLPENKTWAKQSIAHNTLVVDEKSHFNGKVKVATKYHPELNYFAKDKQVVVSSAKIDTAYKNVSFKRTIALLNLPDSHKPLVVDILKATSPTAHQYDLPVHYLGQFIHANFDYKPSLTQLSVLGTNNGYQHLWLNAIAQPKTDLAKVTWLNKNGRFYTLSTLNNAKNNDKMQVLFTELGANDPNFNLRNEHAFITRIPKAKNYTFVSILEPHGEYNPSKEYTLKAKSEVTGIEHQVINNIDVVVITLNNKLRYIFAINQDNTLNKSKTFNYAGHTYPLSGRFMLSKLAK